MKYWKVTVTPAYLYGNSCIVEAETKEEAKKIAYKKQELINGGNWWEGKKMRATEYHPKEWRITDYYD